MWRTAAGLAIIATIANAFNLLNVDPNYQAIAKGTILVVALCLDSYGRRLAASSRRRSAGADLRAGSAAVSTDPVPAGAGGKDVRS
jgi:ABC-type xylose transport system permease subunit